ASDGVWEVLGPHGLEEVLLGHPDPESAAKALVDAAIGAGGEGNATAQVVRIEDLAEGTFNDLLREGADLPIPPMLVPGQRIDNFEVMDQLHESERRLLYKVKDLSSGRMLTMKTLKSEFVMDARARNALLMEEWLVKKASSPSLPQYFPAKRHFLYFLTSWHEGATLGEMLERGHRFTIAEASQIGMKLARALGAVHRLDIIHRDIRPENLHLGKDGKLRILSISSAMNPALGETAFSGDPDYAAPECLSGGEATIQSDIFAMGVTLYHLLTGEYPYSGSFDPVKPGRYRPDIPAWLENVIMKSIARDPERRFEMPEECLVALENGESSPIQAPPKTPVIGRISAWKLTAVISMLVNFLLLYVDMMESAGISSGPPW
ncbi:MAG TPA: protein kinase, partial [Burkholderiales bacterium]|nr:protein kinase [Burkholderiales bacterium]